VSYTNWIEKFQSNSGETFGKTCAQLMLKGFGNRFSTGEWLPTSCLDQKFYVCERGKNLTLLMILFLY